VIVALEPDPLVSKMPPRDEAAERAVLGCLILDGAAVDDVRPLLAAPAAFRSVPHQQIYSTICGMADAEQPVDALTVAAQLDDQGVLDQCGGGLYLAELSEGVLTSANAAYFARRIAACYLRRELIAASAQVQHLAYESRGLSGEEVARSAEAAIHEATGLDTTAREPQALAELAVGVAERYFAASRGEIEPYLKTGLFALDRLSGGIEPGSYVVLAALSSHGKTSMAVSILRHLAQTTPCALITLEMRAANIARAIVAADARVEDALLRQGLPLSGGLDALQDAVEAASKQLWVLDCTDPGSGHIDAVISQARRLVARHGVRLLCVDYLQLIEVDAERGRNREQEVAEISRRLKRLGMQTGCAIVALAQLNADAQRRGRPSVGDLRESKAIRHDADQVWLLWRPAMFDEDEPHSRAWCAVAKNREGPTGEVELYWHGPSRTFSNTR